MSLAMAGHSWYASLADYVFIRPPGTVVPFQVGLCFTADVFLFVSGTLRRYISELPQPIAVKLSDMIESV